MGSLALFAYIGLRIVLPIVLITFLGTLFKGIQEKRGN